MKGLLLVVSAPSGAGKSSLIDALLKADPQLRLSVSYTTRPPRPGEQNGREYHFVDEKTFMEMLTRGEFLESAQVHGHRYGTSQAVIRQALARGEDLVLEIDWQGAQQVRRLHPDCIGVFILPPSIAELERRMRARAQDSEDVIRRRLSVAEEEISHAPEFEYAIINSNFDEAKQDLQAIIRVERLKRRNS
jgi:guanylate kinase